MADSEVIVIGGWKTIKLCNAVVKHLGTWLHVIIWKAENIPTEFMALGEEIFFFFICSEFCHTLK